MRILLAGAVLVLAAAGCGSATVAELPPPAGPAASPPLERDPAGRVVALGDRRRVPAPRRQAPVEAGRQVAVVAPRARVVETFDARTHERVGRAPAGVGPTQVASNGRQLLYVADTAGDGLLVLHTRPGLEVFRRVAFPGGAPYAVAHDPVRDRVWVTLTGANEVAELNSGTRPGVLRRYPTVRRPVAVAVHPGTGRVTVTGDGARQTFAPAPPGP